MNTHETTETTESELDTLLDIISYPCAVLLASELGDAMRDEGLIPSAREFAEKVLTKLRTGGRYSIRAEEVLKLEIE
jgi:hypothetical protein